MKEKEFFLENLGNVLLIAHRSFQIVALHKFKLNDSLINGIRILFMELAEATPLVIRLNSIQFL